MTGRRVRVLVVDDSAFARKVLREVLSRSPRIEVVGADGMSVFGAIEQTLLMQPDV